MTPLDEQRLLLTKKINEAIAKQPSSIEGQIALLSLAALGLLSEQLSELSSTLHSMRHALYTLKEMKRRDQ